MNFALAGHVDHGKSSLVKAITGVWTDRLEEERRRGLTIDLGFAYRTFGDTRVGFVDVPGHSRFIHNMLAGVNPDQHALMVVAVDDGPMPQSIEHLQIMQLAGLRAGTVVLTKIDGAPAERVRDVHAELDRLLQGTFLETAQRFPVDSLSGNGVDALLQHLESTAATHERDAHDARFRLAIDRAFVLKGTGAIVTGTVASGRVARGDTVRLFPGGESVRVRELRAQDDAAEAASRGMRCALNVVGVEIDALRRGMWLHAGSAQGHDQIVVDLTVLDDFPRTVKHWLPVHVYHATTHSIGHLAMLAANRLAPGDTERVELLLDAPVLAKRFDRVVVRDQGLDRTLGGGPVIDNRPSAKRRRRHPTRLAQIAAASHPDAVSSLIAHLENGPLETAPFCDLWDVSVESLAADAQTPSVHDHNGTWVLPELWEQWRNDTLAEVHDQMQAHTHEQGRKANELMRVPTAFRDAVLADLVNGGALTVNAGRYSTPDFQVTLSETEQRLLDRVAPLMQGTQPPSAGDMAKELRIAQPAFEKGLAALAAKGCVVRVADKRYFLPEPLRDLAELAERLQRFTVREFRDASGAGRNTAIQVLEYFDSRGFTRRYDNERAVVGDVGRALQQR